VENHIKAAQFSAVTNNFHIPDQQLLLKVTLPWVISDPIFLVSDIHVRELHFFHLVYSSYDALRRITQLRVIRVIRKDTQFTNT
jgi:hypothetical protein